MPNKTVTFETERVNKNDYETMIKDLETSSRHHEYLRKLRKKCIEENKKLKEEIEEKRVVHGGCVVTEDSKQFVCRDCKYKWGSLDIFRKNDTTNTNYRKPCEDL